MAYRLENNHRKQTIQQRSTTVTSIWNFAARSCGRNNFTLFFCQVMSMLDPHTVNMFHFSGPKYTTPNCPVDMAPNFNPSSGAQSYRRSTKDCSQNSYYNIPFFLDRPGPKYEEWSVNAHEARPGHHTQVELRLHLNTFLVIYFM